ncbi:hypothetical protein SAMD00024442_23_27 [Candidatus Symbiothrix dinenymphae]|nr:hypothetical protein SAMD00024442_23_27 [Candidatus Symbiothrix dinenymphae]
MVIFPAMGFAQAKYLVRTDFMPLVFDGKFAFFSDTLLTEDSSDFYPYSDVFGGKNKYIRQMRKRARHAALWRNNLPAARYVASDIAGKPEKEVPLAPEVLHDVFEVHYELNADLDKTTKYVPERQYWFPSGSSFLQFSQNRLSDNWYTGGYDHLNLQSIQNYTINYRSDKMQFNNFIEWKLSLYTNPKDTVRGTRLGENLIRYYGDFGLRASAHWSYSTNVEIKTQVFRSYNENSNDVIGAIFSPLNVNMGILGMKYHFERQSKKDKHRKTVVDADISPLAAQYTYVEDESVNPTRYGVVEGFHDLLNYGSSVNATTVITFNSQISFTSRLRYFTDYEHVLLESENALNLTISRLLSARFYLYARFDDTPGIKNDSDLGFWQLTEVFSFGFNYKF